MNTLKLERGNQIKIIHENEELIISNCYGLQVQGKYKTSLKEIDFQNALENLKNELLNGVYYKEKDIESTLKKLEEYINNIHKLLKIDKSILLQGLEKTRNYEFRNYYNHIFIQCNLQENKILKEEISKLKEEKWNLKREHEKEIIVWQKKLTDAQNIKVKKQEVETSLDFDMDCHANCPYCDSWEQIEIIDYEGGEYETNHECESCGNWFSVRAGQ